MKIDAHLINIYSKKSLKIFIYQQIINTFEKSSIQNSVLKVITFDM